MKRRIRALWFAGILLLAMPAGALAQGPRGDETDRPGPSGELREAMQDYFEKRLRSALSLSDEQVSQILPLVRRLEDSKREVQRARMDSVRRLRRGLEQGASDTELQEQLDRLDRSGREQWETERELIEEVDRVLSTRQRVQLRFFLQHFRREMQEKVGELRGDRQRGRARGPRRERP
jgi:superfamily I DNA/RNA helicase